MIAFVKGKLEETAYDSVIVDVNGIGMEIFTSAYVISAMPRVGEEVKLYTYFHIREDIMQLYGFLSKDDLDIFKLLINVNGIGPKAALAVLSSMPADTLIFAILSEDIKTIEKAQGIGVKTAKKLVLELKDKISSMSEAKILKNEEITESRSVSEAELKVKDEALEVLAALGYSLAEAMKALNKVKISENMTSEDIIKLALKNF